MFRNRFYCEKKQELRKTHSNGLCHNFLHGISLCVQSNQLEALLFNLNHFNYYFSLIQKKYIYIYMCATIGRFSFPILTRYFRIKHAHSCCVWDLTIFSLPISLSLAVGFFSLKFISVHLVIFIWIDACNVSSDLLCDQRAID